MRGARRGACSGVACPAGAVPGGACFLCRLPTTPLAFFSAPYPPAPLTRRGRGSPRLFHARGFAPCIPGVEPGRHRSGGESRAGGGLAPALPTVPGGRAVPRLACATCRSRPRRGGGRGREVSQRRGWQAAKRENFPPVAAPCKKIFKSP